MADYTAIQGGNDLINERTMLITDLIRGTQYETMIVDFFIDENMNGIVYFDGMEILRQSNIGDYNILETLFYSQFSIEM